MAKILEKKTISNGKTYSQFMVTISPTLIKHLGWKGGDDVVLKSDPQNTYLVVEKSRSMKG